MRRPAVDWNGVFPGLFGDRRQRLNVGNRHRSPARLDQSAGLPSREQPADGEQRRAGHLRQLFARKAHFDGPIGRPICGKSRTSCRATRGPTLSVASSRKRSSRSAK